MRNTFLKRKHEDVGSNKPMQKISVGGSDNNQEERTLIFHLRSAA